jgi:glycosyltransferase involved in cell wall biosynthesis
VKNGQITIMFPVNQLGVGGAEQQLLELVRGIDKRRFKPIVVSLYPGGAVEPEVKEVPGVELVCLNRKGRFDFSTLSKVFHLLRQKRVEIIQPFLTPASFFGLVPSLATRNLVKIVTERCGVRVNPNIGSALYRKTEDFLTRFADWVIPNSQAGETYLINRGIKPERIKVIYNGINLNRLAVKPSLASQIRDSMRLPEGGQVVGITASLTPAKDHTTFFRAAKIVSQVMPQTGFAVLGDGPLRADLENMVRDLGLEQRTVFFGRQREVGSYVSVYDVACLSSKDHEGCSNATLEAMALGKPVVITDVGGNRELVECGKTGFLVPPGNSEALADALLTCLQKPQEARQMGENARQKVMSQFTVEHMVAEYQSIYEKAVLVKRNVYSRNTVAKSLLPYSNNSQTGI